MHGSNRATTGAGLSSGSFAFNFAIYFFRFFITGPAQGHTRSHKVTQGHTRSHKVTQGHTRSHKVTQGHTRSHKVTQDFACAALTNFELNPAPSPPIRPSSGADAPQSRMLPKIFLP